jgi:minor extracellular serine protease Vpr
MFVFTANKYYMIHFKKPLCAILLIVLNISTILAQEKMAPSTKCFIHELSNIQESNLHAHALPQQLIAQYGLYEKRGEYFVGALALVHAKIFKQQEMQQQGIIVSTQLGDLVSMRIPLSQMEFVIGHPSIKYLEVGESVSPDINKSIVNTKAKDVHAGLGGLAKSYQGENVIVAIIDWGFDYTHPMFYDSSLTKLRLTRAWDQNKLSGPPPSGYDFGTEYKGMNELLAAKEDTLYVFGPGSHGTHVGGIAGGSGGGTIYKGTAPKSELIFISLRRDAPSLIDAFSYLSNYADSVGKPFVVNMSFGAHMGPHDGSSLENRGIDAMAGKGKVFVGSAGNNGSTAFHLKHQFRDSTDTLYTVVNFGNVPNQFGQAISMWGSANTSFGVKLRLVNASNQMAFETNYYLSANNTVTVDTFLVGTNDTLIVRITATAKSTLNDKPNIRVEVKKVSALKLVLCATSADSSELHIWNVMRLHNRFTNWGVELTSNYPGAKAGNIEYGLGEPAGVGKSVITVASHILDVMNAQDSILSFGPISPFSSRGPTVDGRVKPDISGPGQNIMSSVNSFDPANGNPEFKVAFNGKEYPFAVYSGTSMSGPAVAGVVALMLQASPNLSASEIKQIIQQTARLDQQTGQIGAAGSLTWGRGKVNALAAVLAAETFTSLKDIHMNPDHVRMYPNPASHMVQIDGVDVDAWKIYDLTGSLILDKKKTDANNQMDISTLQDGIYLVMLKVQGQAIFQKLVVKH